MKLNKNMELNMTFIFTETAGKPVGNDGGRRQFRVRHLPHEEANQDAEQDQHQPSVLLGSTLHCKVRFEKLFQHLS